MSSPDAGAVPLVLLPGMNCTGRLWPAIGPAPVLTRRLAEPSVTAQVERLLDELPGRFALAGLSLGAVVAMALVNRAPERVTGLALLATNPAAPTELQRGAWRRARERLAAGETARDLQRDWLPDLLSPAARRRSELVEQVLQMADETGETDLDAQLRMQATRIDLRPDLGRVRVPTLVVAAELDALCSVDRHRELTGLIGGARLVVLAGAGHLAPLEAGDRIAELLDRWSPAARPTRDSGATPQDSSAAPSDSAASLA